MKPEITLPLEIDQRLLAEREAASDRLRDLIEETGARVYSYCRAPSFSHDPDFQRRRGPAWAGFRRSLLRSWRDLMPRALDEDDWQSS